MDFSFYPIQDSDFYKTKIDVMKATDNCLNSLEYKENGERKYLYSELNVK